MKEKSFKSNELFKQHLMSVLRNTGNISKSKRFLHHYTSIDKVVSIIKSNTFWLGSTQKMNDHFEFEYINYFNYDKKLYLSSFSKIEENLAMYDMYASNDNGVMLSFSYEIADEIINANKSSEGRIVSSVVRNNGISNDEVDIDLFWTAVGYKDLHSNKIFYEKTEYDPNFNIFNDDYFVGFIKLFGWEYEHEVRLCARTKGNMNVDEMLAIKLPSQFYDNITITTSPMFDKQKNKSDIAYLKRNGVLIKASEYESFVDLGKISTKKMLDDKSFSIINEVLEWLDDLGVYADNTRMNLERALTSSSSKRKALSVTACNEFINTLSDMSSEYNNHINMYKNKLKYIGDFERTLSDFDSSIKEFMTGFRKLFDKYIGKALSDDSLKENNILYQSFVSVKEKTEKIFGDYLKGY